MKAKRQQERREEEKRMKGESKKRRWMELLEILRYNTQQQWRELVCERVSCPAKTTTTTAASDSRRDGLGCVRHNKSRTPTIISHSSRIMKRKLIEFTRKRISRLLIVITLDRRWRINIISYIIPAPLYGLPKLKKEKKNCERIWFHLVMEWRVTLQAF